MVGVKRKTTDLLRLNISVLAKGGGLEVGRNQTQTWTRRGETVGSMTTIGGDGYLTLSYTVGRGDSKQSMEYKIYLDHTPCHLGGSRVWFKCPSCDKRVAMLYGGKVFACRLCNRLNYHSQCESDLDLATRRIDKLREKMGWEAGCLNGYGWKPKSMHWKTYNKLRAEYDVLERVLFKRMNDAFGGALFDQALLDHMEE